MERNLFNTWNQKKQRIDDIKKRILFRERDIIFMKIGKNIGDEQDGNGEDFLRPVVVIRKFNQNIFWGLPLTSRLKEADNPYYFNIGVIRKKKNWAILSQGRCFDVRRAKHKLGLLDDVLFKDLKKSIQKILLTV